MRPKQQRHFVSSQRIGNLHLRARVSRTHLRLNDFPTRSLVRARPNRRLLRAATKAPRRKRPCRPRPPAIGPKFVRSARMEPLNDTIAPVIVPSIARPLSPYDPVSTGGTRLASGEGLNPIWLQACVSAWNKGSDSYVERPGLQDLSLVEEGMTVRSYVVNRPFNCGLLSSYHSLSLQ